MEERSQQELLLKSRLSYKVVLARAVEIGVWRRRASPPCQSDESKGTWEDLKVGEFAPGGGGVQYQGPTGMVCREG